MKILELITSVFAGILWLSSLIMLISGVIYLNAPFVISGIVFLMLTTYWLKTILDRERSRIEKIELEKEKEISLKDKDIDYLQKELVHIGSVTEKIKELDEGLNKLSERVEKLSEIVGRVRYECIVCKTVFFTDSNEKFIKCPVCCTDFVADTPEKLGMGFEYWCLYGNPKDEEDYGIFPVQKGGWKPIRRPLSKEEYLKRFKNNDLPERDQPDFQFYYLHPSEGWEQKFQIECKWRKETKYGKIDVENLKKYEKFDNEEYGKVFLVIGIGRPPVNPSNVYVLPYSAFSDEEKKEGYILETTLNKRGLKRKGNKGKLNITKDGKLVWYYGE